MILLSFASLIGFHVLVGFAPVDLALAIAAGIALLVLAADHALSSGGIKLLNLGTFALFAALSLVGVIAHVAWNPLWVRLMVNAGLLAAVLFTFAIRQPFTLQYAREGTPASFGRSPAFLRANYLISAVWAAVFGVLVLADLARLFSRGSPLARYGGWHRRNNNRNEVYKVVSGEGVRGSIFAPDSSGDVDEQVTTTASRRYRLRDPTAGSVSHQRAMPSRA
jgi:hypothetical protein